MPELKFEGLGTHWGILIDEPIPKNLETEVSTLISAFESQYSRFKPDSEISLLKTAVSPYQLSHELETMLSLGLILQDLTKEHFNLNLGQLISGWGYDQSLSFKRDQELVSRPLSRFSIKKHELIFDSPLHLDLGALGKGYLINKISQFLLSKNLRHFLIDGGGDIFATNKHDHSPWQVAIEHPTDQSKGIGTVSLQHQAVATSSSQKRKHQDFHHLLNPITKRPSHKLLSLSVLTTNAFTADALATALFVSPQNLWPILVNQFHLDYLAVYPDFHVDHTPAFSNLF